MKEIQIPTEEALRKSIKNNIFYYYVSLFAWVGFLLYGIAYKDGYLWLSAMMFFMAAINFNLSQKVDKSRLEVMLKK